jgi:UDP-3-O-[3-hydroxymyristoyl] glucosamine N-acyltransferase
MSAPSFFQRGAGLSVGEIAELTRAEPRPGADLRRRITGIAALDLAAPTDLVFLDKPKYAQELSGTSAGACLTRERYATCAPACVSVLCVSDPYRAYVEVAHKLFPEASRPSSLFNPSGSVAGAFVHSTARIESAATVDPSCVIGAYAEIGAGTHIAAGAVIGPNVRIGRHCVIGAQACVTHSLIGDRVIVHPGCAIGQDGFGYLMSPRGHRKIPQLGRVIIQDDVEIGAGTTIDRGSNRDTVVGEGSKIDNQVQIAHNVSIGRRCIIVSQCGISGSVIIEDYAVLAGAVGLADNLSIGEGAVVGARSGVMSDIPKGERWFGYPAMRAREYFRAVAAFQEAGRKRRSVQQDDKMRDQDDE